ncbi:unnamed protein product [Leptidea sinapis]|uniref:Major facilitator superfamily (MFS) profile domain-containing protein n=1 Tax=Leptidea sinapis TaxID=189913 RepID=A0A5E4R436_9NEOP|nr:unnamed protein product [Leptidea sinapis]
MSTSYPPTNRRIQYLAGLCVSFAFTFTGAALSWSSPAIPKFKNGDADIDITDEQSSWVVSLFAPGALCGCYVGQILNEKVGRRFTVLSAAGPSFLGSVIILFSRTPWVMCISRFVTGIGMGITAVVTMVYLTEIADKDIRGSLGMLVQVMNNMGSLAVYSIGPFVSYNGLNALLVSLSIIYATMCLWIPESPYYHLKDGRPAAAKKSFMFLKGTKNEKWATEQLTAMRLHVQESMENKTTVKELLTNMRYRKTLYLIAGLKVLQYMTGMCAIQAYLEIIFRQGIGATFIIDHFGRRLLMLISSTGVALSLTTVGIYFYLQDAYQLNPERLASLSAVPLVGVLSYIILYSIGLGNLPYFDEIVSRHKRCVWPLHGILGVCKYCLFWYIFYILLRARNKGENVRRGAR